MILLGVPTYDFGKWIKSRNFRCVDGEGGLNENDFMRLKGGDQ